ncbi:hypothetical protein H0274_03495 [Altererythrobacter sp. CC-YST694]|uniref:hypothetical protein n=1 Tax=Altererythrobacter sp. CC-YST694 TaxID=2755038 RepID=UPI001D0117EB|nr:hypothetical protein [Altererythrobacter sp. CC-YST694]MCB5424314.1 hypothetical protein [Altererythrobacter sp. CC-YST694]
MAATAACALLATPLAARDEDKPVTDDTVTARDVAVTPIQDLNLEKDEIPPLLLAAQADPYSLAGLNRCSKIVVAVEELDKVLGPDFDVADANERKMTVGSVAKSVVGALIPFRGVIREISGANKHEREFQDAIVAGVMRRAYLKGIGLKQGCQYPARPATDADRARVAKAREQAKLVEQQAEYQKDVVKDREKEAKKAADQANR